MNDHLSRQLDAFLCSFRQISRRASTAPAGRPRFATARKHGTNQRRQGLTLLELLLALSLSVIILAAVAMAVDLQLRTLETRRTYLEEAQLARAVLRMIGNDLRAAVYHRPQDYSAVEGMLASIGAEAVEELVGDDLGDLGAGDVGAGDLDGMAGDGGGDVGGGDDPLLDEEEAVDEDTTDIASSVEPPPVPGLYGNPFELQVDVSRLPRPDELQSWNNAMTGAQTDPVGLASPVSQLPSDLRTVAWFVQGGTTIGGVGGAGAAGQTAGAGVGVGSVLSEFGQMSSGLVRRELGRSEAQWAATSGSSQQIQGVGELLAPEITAIQFQYFDGYQWYPEWNSDEFGALPMAVEITLFMQPAPDLLADEPAMPDPSLTSQSSAGMVQGQLVYRLVVRIPTAEPLVGEESESDSSLEELGL